MGGYKALAMYGKKGDRNFPTIISTVLWFLRQERRDIKSEGDGETVYFVWDEVCGKVCCKKVGKTTAHAIRAAIKEIDTYTRMAARRQTQSIQGRE